MGFTVACLLKETISWCHNSSSNYLLQTSMTSYTFHRYQTSKDIPCRLRIKPCIIAISVSRWTLQICKINKSCKICNLSNSNNRFKSSWDLTSNNKIISGILSVLLMQLTTGKGSATRSSLEVNSSLIAVSWHRKETRHLLTINDSNLHLINSLCKIHVEELQACWFQLQASGQKFKMLFLIRSNYWLNSKCHHLSHVLRATSVMIILVASKLNKQAQPSNKIIHRQFNVAHFWKISKNN